MSARLSCLAAIALFAAFESQAPMPAPATASYVRGAREKRDDECRTCHTSAARTHAPSLHAHAFDDASFQKGYALEPKPFCRGCHAPESAPANEPDAFARTRGVTCVTCHLPSGADAIVTGSASAHPGPTSATAARAGATSTTSATSATSASAPHAISRVADFGTRACASCHEFAFPGAEGIGPEGLMQKTMTEHADAAPAARDRTCASCHMPRDERGHATHEFAASRDVTLLTHALDVRAARVDDSARFELTANDIGHAFPTGDLFRRLVIRVQGPRGATEHPLTRSFRSRPNQAGASTRFETSDTRVRSGATVTIQIGAARVAWEIVYQRVLAVGQTPPFATTVEDEIVLARGVL